MEYKKDEVAENIVESLDRDFSVVQKRRINAWYIYAFVGVVIGAIITFGYLSRNGALSSSEASMFGRTYTHEFEAWYKRPNGQVNIINFYGRIKGSSRRNTTWISVSSNSHHKGTKYYGNTGDEYTGRLTFTGARVADQKLNYTKTINFPAQPEEGKWKIIIGGSPLDRNGFYLLSKEFIPTVNEAPGRRGDDPVYVPGGSINVGTSTNPNPGYVPGGSINVPTSTTTSTPVGSAPVGGTKVAIAPNISSRVLGWSSNRTRITVDNLSEISLSLPGNAYTTTINKLVLNFSGPAIYRTSAFSVNLIDASTGTSFANSTSQTCSVTQMSCSVTFTPNYVLTPGNIKNLRVQLNSGSFSNIATAQDPLIITINNTSDFIYSSDAGSNQTISSSKLPVLISSVSYE
ncbi:MAG: hypothetical protein COU06_01885 [Candidatus Harrisonbacteria bacterium CG10_big_fil_rev_8_21_14_0_10_38_8]|uniref:Uncharacterized protein n=1 Tax=Candidatus Harrisonbacteria bacterium CG10_big_fil_rev_8_21_14_0_10_38_8 TaxID=1974582 RepID=A0A2M6WJX0_9BACT|nr:MAG: hypothetical protein COU06_01885 [Candidatus Harrisonbacteria bacterium CG10_big_fil_rev_8_21_14_0_10_38_8]